MLEGTPPEAHDFVAPWVGMAAPALRNIPPHLHAAERRCHCENEVVRLSLANLATFPWVAEAVASGRLDLHGFRFDIHTGVLEQIGADGATPVQ
jgi:carbonic anhydrase